MAAMQKLLKCVVSPTGKHSASVIFLHGSGDTGQGLRAWVQDVMMPGLTFDHIRVIYPTAPARPYTPMYGALSNVWFDRYKISNNSPEHLQSIDAMCCALGSIIQDEVTAGIPKHRIIIGFTCENSICCEVNMKTRELPMGEKQTILKLREEGKSLKAIAQILGIANTKICNVLKKRETTGVLSNRHRTRRPNVSTAVADRNIVRAVNKHPKTTVSDITANLLRARVRVSESTVRRRL
ncbi:lysophospholipase-like protein 1 isoform X2 [Phyllopteryx taeniolatus]|uniref:lysophospholipase-like protein 1 isoform X2 n=1 Tax=Phyllopteryx taeniolatus TaxID=161469 RepID=UPI002AD50EAF|nr:lysophospholipase-like protein 1 isoform X2 [Phyllopteryx taeniolatus]